MWKSHFFAGNRRKCSRPARACAWQVFPSLEAVDRARNAKGIRRYFLCIFSSTGTEGLGTQISALAYRECGWLIHVRRTYFFQKNYRRLNKNRLSSTTCGEWQRTKGLCQKMRKNGRYYVSLFFPLQNYLIKSYLIWSAYKNWRWAIFLFQGIVCQSIHLLDLKF